MRVGYQPSSLRALGNGDGRAAAKSLRRLSSQARYVSRSFRFLFQKARRVFCFSKVCLALVLCRYQTKVKMGGCTCASIHALGDLPPSKRPQRCGDVSVSHSPWSCLLTSLVWFSFFSFSFLTVLLVLTFPS